MKLFFYKLGLGNVRILIFLNRFEGLCPSVSVSVSDLHMGSYLWGICWQTLNVFFVMKTYFSYLVFVCVFLCVTGGDSKAIGFLAHL